MNELDLSQTHLQNFAWECIPLEIWLVIFDHATSVPSYFYNHEQTWCPPTKDDQETIDSQRKTQYRLIFVCRAWRDLAIQHLYRFVSIQSRQQYWKLAETLQRSLRRHDPLPLGHRIYDLQIPVSIIGNDAGASIIRKAVHLRLLAIWDDTETGFGPLVQNVLRIVARACPNLEEYYAPFISDGLGDTTPASVFYPLPKLRTVITTSGYDNASALTCPMFSSTTLTHLGLHPIFDATPPSANNFPSLRALTIIFSSTTHAMQDFAVKTLALYGGQLDQVTFSMLLTPSFVDVNFVSLSAAMTMQFLYSVCTKLTTLLLVGPMELLETFLGAYSTTSHLPPSLCLLGFSCSTTTSTPSLIYLKHRVLRRVFMTMTAAQGLRKFRLLNRKTERTFGDPSVVHTFRPQFASIGRRWEKADGELM